MKNNLILSIDFRKLCKRTDMSCRRRFLVFVRVFPSRILKPCTAVCSLYFFIYANRKSSETPKFMLHETQQKEELYRKILKVVRPREFSTSFLMRAVQKYYIICMDICMRIDPASTVLCNAYTLCLWTPASSPKTNPATCHVKYFHWKTYNELI